MYVCICQAVTEKQLRTAITHGAHSMRALRNQLGVASCCGKCAAAARQILHETHHPHRRR